MTDQRGPVRKNSAQTQTRLSASNRNELVREYAAGVPVTELADRFGVHRSTVVGIAKRAGTDLRQRTLPRALREQAARRYADGLTLLAVVEELGISYSAARSAVVACGGALRPRGRRPM